MLPWHLEDRLPAARAGLHDQRVAQADVGPELQLVFRQLVVRRRQPLVPRLQRRHALQIVPVLQPARRAPADQPRNRHHMLGQWSRHPLYHHCQIASEGHLQWVWQQGLRKLAVNTATMSDISRPGEGVPSAWLSC